MNLLDLYDETQKCSKKKNATNEMKCLRLRLTQEIDGDIDKLALYEVRCEGACDFGTYSVIFSTIALIVSVFAIVADYNKNLITVVAMSIIYMLIAVFYGIYITTVVPKYRRMKKVLEEIRRTMEKKR